MNKTTLLLITFIIRVVLALCFYGGTDVDNTIWVADLLRNRINVYDAEVFPHTPLLLFLHILPAKLSNVTFLPFSFWWKFLSIIADSIIVLYIFKITFAFWKNSKKAFLAGLAYALNPISLIITCFHGQWEPIIIMLVVISLDRLIFRKNSFDIFLSAICLGTSIAGKGFTALLLPLFCLQLKESFRIKILYCLFALAAVIIPMTPYLTDPYLAQKMMYKIVSYPSIPLFGIGPLLKGIIQPITDNIFPALSHLINIYYYNHRFFLISGFLAVYIIIFLQKRGLIYSIIMIFLIFYSMSPRIVPQYLFWIVPFAIICEQRCMKYYTLAASLFMISSYVLWLHNYGVYSEISFVRFLAVGYHQFQAKWLNEVRLWTGNILFPIVVITWLVTSIFTKKKVIPQAPNHIVVSKTSRMVTNSAILCFIILMHLTSIITVYPCRKTYTPPMPELSRSKNMIYLKTYYYYGTTHFFRRSFQLKSQIKNAYVNITSDDFFSLFINGKFILNAFGSNYRHNHDSFRDLENPLSVDISQYLIKGDNIIAIKENCASTRTPIGLGTQGEIVEKDGNKILLNSSTEWKVTLDPKGKDWFKFAYDDSGWDVPIIKKPAWKAALDPKDKEWFNFRFVHDDSDWDVPVIKKSESNQERNLFLMTSPELSSPKGSFSIVHLLIYYSILFFVLTIYMEIKNTMKR